MRQMEVILNIEKTFLSNIPDCYAVANIPLPDKNYVLFASEGDDICLAYSLTNLSDSFTVWEHPGGTMGMVPIPNKPGEFLAVQKYYRLWDWEEAKLVWVQIDKDKNVKVTDLITLPYIHRFDLLERNGEVYLLACSIATHKPTLKDWPEPGIVYSAKLPDSPDIPLKLEVLRDDFYKNHGYARVNKDGQDIGFVTCDNGGFLFTPPADENSSWMIEKIIDGNFSEGDMIDIDGDGEQEIALISPFHGSNFEIYKMIEGAYRKVYEFPEPADFFHVAHAGYINKKPVFLGGGRGGEEKLFYVSYDSDTKEFITTVIDSGQGPSNACIVNYPDYDYVFAANRNTGQAYAYKINQ